MAGPTSRVVPKLEKAAELLTNVCKLLGSPARAEI
jgi:hypothetical protein